MEIGSGQPSPLFLSQLAPTPDTRVVQQRIKVQIFIKQEFRKRSPNKKQNGRRIFKQMTQPKFGRSGRRNDEQQLGHHSAGSPELIWVLACFLLLLTTRIVYALDDFMTLRDYVDPTAHNILPMVCFIRTHRLHNSVCPARSHFLSSFLKAF